MGVLMLNLERYWSTLSAMLLECSMPEHIALMDSMCQTCQ